MKVLRFDLMAYGPFSGQALDLSAGAHGLHLVYGPNEAGKSTALRALKCLLYGFPHSTADDFLHASPQLRVGGLLRSAGGELLDCVRRKGKKDTLRSADETTVLDPRPLATWLGGIDGEAFTRRFGISYEELVQGGAAIARGQGDLGQSLFAAAAGVVDLANVGRQLTDDAEALFKGSATKPKLNALLREFKDQQQKAKEALLPSADWLAREKALADATERLKKLENELVVCEREKRQAERFTQALPDVGLRAQLITDLSPLVATPRLDVTFDKRQREARQALAVAQIGETAAQKALHDLDQELTSLRVPAKLLARRDEIDALKEALGSYRKAQKDRPNLVGIQQTLAAACEKLCLQLGPQVTVAKAQALIPTAAERARLQKLAGQFSKLEVQWEQCGKSLRELTQNLAQVESELSAAGAPENLQLLRSAVRQAERRPRAESELSETQKQLCHCQKLIEASLGELPAWQGTLDDLLARPKPLPETVEVFRQRLDEAAAQVRDCRRAVTTRQRDIQALERQVEQMRLQHDAPTEDDVAAARRLRDAGWSLVLQAWQRPPAPAAEVTAFVASLTPAETLAQAYELAVRRADELADRMRREAAQVALKTKLLADLGSARAELEHEAAALALAQAAANQLQSEWELAWQAVGVAPRSPAEMAPWLARVGRLADQKTERDRLLLDERRLSDEVHHLRGMLLEGMQAAAVSMPASESLADDLQAAAAQLAVFDEQARKREKLADAKRDYQKALPAAQKDQSDIRGQLEQWRKQWGQSMTGLGLSAEATPEEALAVLGVLEELRVKLADCEATGERIAGIDREAALFVAHVAELVAVVASELSHAPPADAANAAETLSRERLEAEKLAERRSAREKTRAQEEGRRRQFCEDRQQAAQQLKLLCEDARCATVDELPAVAERALRRADLEKALHEVEERLRRSASDTPLEVFVNEVRAKNEADLFAELQRLDRRLTDLALERDLARDTLGAAQRDVNAMQGSATAAEANAQVELLASQVVATAEEYCRLGLAAAVLHRAVERYRQKNQGGLLLRAGELFQELTCGSFKSLRADCNEAGQPVLVGVRPSGALVGVEGLSRGTCDQLYLALRLASVEAHCRAPGVEPLPFIVDDVLIQFDDDRSVAALKALARLAETTQVIYFTHHDHIVNLAREYLDDDLLFVHRLGGLAPALAAAQEPAP